MSTTSFQDRVYAATRQIPSGYISTYKDIAIKIGNPKASRAVGHALSKNPFAPIVPCHRVVSSTYALAGFRGSTAPSSLAEKASLLQQEGVLITSAFTIDSQYRQTHTFRNFK